MRRFWGVATAPWVWVAMAVVFGTSAGPAGATTVEYMATAAQAASADRIFVGTVTAVTSRPKATAPKYFETAVRFAVEETVAGSVPGTIELVFSGGEVGGLRQRIDGMPELAVGERYVVLLEPDQDPPLVSPFVGFNQGLYRVVGESRAGAVVRDRRGVALSGAGAAGAARAGEPSLDDFLDELRAARRR